MINTKYEYDMRSIYTYLMILATVALSSSCNNEWEDEQYEQYVSFKAPILANSEGVTDIYVRYKADGKVTYQLPVIISGSTVNEQDRDVHIEVDKDTLKTLNIERFSVTRPELWYSELEENKYEFPEVVHIPAGSSVELLNIDFNLQGIDMLEKWVLPLTIVDNPSYNYQNHPRKNYAKALLRVIPFNNYSGSYTSSSMKVYTYINGVPDTTARTMDKRTGYVIDNSTVFFYAGLISEDMDKDVRKKYKINVRFNEDETLTMIPDDPNNEMKFELIGTPTYSSTSVMDATRPYLEHRYVQIMFEYNFQDFTYGGSSVDVLPIKYKVEGSMTLQRDINTQIPDEDQQIEW